MTLIYFLVSNGFKLRISNDELYEFARWVATSNPKNKDEVLSYGDHFLANHDPRMLHKMSRRTKRMWVRHLEVAERAYKNEMDNWEEGQSVLTNYFRILPRTEDGGG